MERGGICQNMEGPDESDARTHSHAHTNTHTHTRARAHTHTHTGPSPSPCLLLRHVVLCGFGGPGRAGQPNWVRACVRVWERVPCARTGRRSLSLSLTHSLEHALTLNHSLAHSLTHSHSLNHAPLNRSNSLTRPLSLPNPHSIARPVSHSL